MTRRFLGSNVLAALDTFILTGLPTNVRHVPPVVYKTPMTWTILNVCCVRTVRDELISTSHVRHVPSESLAAVPVFVRHVPTALLQTPEAPPAQVVKATEKQTTTNLSVSVPTDKWDLLASPEVVRHVEVLKFQTRIEPHVSPVPSGKLASAPMMSVRLVPALMFQMQMLALVCPAPPVNMPSGMNDVKHVPPDNLQAAPATLNVRHVPTDKSPEVRVTPPARHAESGNTPLMNKLVVKFALTDYNPTRTEMTVSHVRTVTPALAEHALPAATDNALMNLDLHVKLVRTEHNPPVIKQHVWHVPPAPQV